MREDHGTFHADGIEDIKHWQESGALSNSRLKIKKNIQPAPCKCIIVDVCF